MTSELFVLVTLPETHIFAPESLDDWKTNYILSFQNEGFSGVLIMLVFGRCPKKQGPTNPSQTNPEKLLGHVHMARPHPPLCQLGGVVVAVTVLSILGAIVTLPAALMLVPFPFPPGGFFGGDDG